MLGIDIAIWLAIALSLASVVLCAVYGWARWNVADEATHELPSTLVGFNAPGEPDKRGDQA